MIEQGSSNVVALNDAATFFKIGKWQYSRRRFISSLNYLKKAVSIDHSHLDSHKLLAEMYIELSDFSSAIEHYEWVLLYKKESQITEKLIQLYIKESRYSDATHLLKEKLNWIYGEFNLLKRVQARFFKDQSEKYYNTLFQLSYLYRETEDFSLALKYAKRLTTIKKDVLSYYFLATIYEAKEDYNNAREAFSKVKDNTSGLSLEVYEKVYQKMVESELIPESYAV